MNELGERPWNKGRIAVIAAAGLLSCELIEALDRFDLRNVAADAPHSHIEMPEGTTAATANNLFASGAVREQSRLLSAAGPGLRH